jgi:hypothetical protein
MKWIVPFLVAFVPLVVAADATKELLTNLPACAVSLFINWLVSANIVGPLL